MRGNIPSAILTVSHFFFPKRCFGCRELHQPFVKKHLCVFCWNQILKPKQFSFPDRANCHVFSAGIYEGLLKKSVIRAKFKHDILCMETISELLNETFEQIPFPIDMITSVPSNYWRTVRRGVDLPAILGRELSKKTDIPFQQNILWKTKSVDRQTGLSKEKRKQNVKGLFKASADIAGKNILIIDDIMTTGSTILACYHALKRKKPNQVIFLTAAKTE